MIIEGIRRKLGPDIEVLAFEAGKKCNAIGETRKASVILTPDHLFIATSVRTKTVLTSVP